MLRNKFIYEMNNKCYCKSLSFSIQMKLNDKVNLKPPLYLIRKEVQTF